MGLERPQAGGEAARSGFVFEDYVAIEQLAGLLDGSVSEFELEGATPEKFEFRAKRNDGVSLYAQVKRRSDEKRWTIVRMANDKGLLEAILARLSIPTARVMFVSNCHCNLGWLAATARSHPAPADFASEIDRSGRTNDLARLRIESNRLGLTSDEVVIGLLQRFEARVVDPKTQRALAEAQLGRHVRSAVLADAINLIRNPALRGIPWASA